MSATSCIDEELVRRGAAVIRAFQEKGRTLVTAESCTAGLIAALLSQGEGASAVLQGGFVAYSKDHKACALGVDEQLLLRAGSVNEKVAEQMAQGALDRSPADIAIAVTGVLGPEPDEDGNPVGLVFLAGFARGGPRRLVKPQHQTLDPDGLRRAVVLDALDLALSLAR
jgi:nicotinamide-nucleotide amidase